MPPLSQRLTLRLALENAPGMLARVTEVLEACGAELVATERTDEQRHVVFRDVTVEVRDDLHGDEVAAALVDEDGVEVLSILDDVLAAHEGGKIRVELTREVGGPQDLALVYTPGVAKVCQLIADDPVAAYRFTIRSNSVAIVTDGSAVLGLGDIGPLASLPVMEGKAMLLKSFGGVDAYPILVDEQDPDTFVDTVARIASGFSGINLEDISAPRCFEIEGKLRQRLDIPVFHDDQHGTAVVVLAALVNAARVVDRELASLRVVVQGIGSAGVAIINLLRAAGIADIVPVDVGGIIEPRRKGTDPIRRRLARQVNPRGLTGGKEVALRDADVFIGVSGPNSLPLELLQTMSPDRIVFALANPTPEIHPDLARGHVRVMATGRSDFPNQINNVLCFPGLFRGLLDAAATAVTDEMKVAAAHGIASIVGDDLGPDYVIPSPFDRSVVPVVAEAVARTAREQGHVRPGSLGSRDSESQAALHEAARRAVRRAVAARFTASGDG
ncbi:NAD-dependent malic enzyme [Egicoccus sp. AB-alg6-2]|uniref:NAD-dependent malic enzyme n=1 Tax=Egicoccus sp. AB-alg6-2 TaxID=3242692 RepID=UPI00359CBC4D